MFLYWSSWKTLGFSDNPSMYVISIEINFGKSCPGFQKQKTSSSKPFVVDVPYNHPTKGNRWTIVTLCSWFLCSWFTNTYLYNDQYSKLRNIIIVLNFPNHLGTGIYVYTIWKFWKNFDQKIIFLYLHETNTWRSCNCIWCN